MRHNDRLIESIGDLVTALKETAGGGLVWFRGQERADWALVPSIARTGGKLDAELTTIKRFKQSATAYLEVRPDNDWEWIFLMQHHRAPTRLLDWTESPVVALYFAVSPYVKDHDDHDAALWCIDPVALNRMAGHKRAFDLDILAFGIDEKLKDYLPENINERQSLLNPVAAIGPRNSRRMVAQSGTFTVIHAEAIPIEEVEDKSHVWRFVIPAASKVAIREELKLLGISELSLFPDLDRVALLVKELTQ